MPRSTAARAAGIGPDRPQTKSAHLLGRRLWVVAHRWAGLTIAVFLAIAGVTGAVLPFEKELTFASRPDAALAVPPTPGAMPLDGVTVAERVERATGASVAFIDLEVSRDRVVRMFMLPRPGGPALPYDLVWADPYDGRIRLTYKWGGVSDGAVNIVPFLFTLHYGEVAGPWGVWAFGVAALIWTVDCFVGLYLTFPVRRIPHRAAAGWLARWRPAWRVRRVRGHKLTFDLHRAGGLWLWPVLFVFAWSGVALALPQAERPVMRAFGASADAAPPPLARPQPRPAVDARRAVALAGPAFRRLGAAQGFAVERLTGLRYDAASGVWFVHARTSLDHLDEGGDTQLWIDGRSGRVLKLVGPDGATRADAFVAWIERLHMAQVFGLPWRIAVSLIGLLVTGLTVTGVLIWTRKRSAALLSRRRRAARG